MVHKRFIFLYPEQEIFDHEISQGAIFFEDPLEESRNARFIPRITAAVTEEEAEALRAEARADRAAAFKPIYCAKLNACIHERYRVNGFTISYATLDDTLVSELIRLHPQDLIVKVGIGHKDPPYEKGRWHLPIS